MLVKRCRVPERTLSLPPWGGQYIRRVVHLWLGKMPYFPLSASEHHNDADEEHDQGYAQQDDFHKGNDRQGAPPVSGPLEQNRPTERVAPEGPGPLLGPRSPCNSMTACSRASGEARRQAPDWGTLQPWELASLGVCGVSEDDSVERLSVTEAAVRLGVTRDAIHKPI